MLAMANTKSAIKNIRKNRSRYLQNRSVVSRLKTLEKKFLTTIESKDLKSATDLSSSFISALDKAAKSSSFTQIRFQEKNHVARAFSLVFLPNFIFFYT